MPRTLPPTQFTHICTRCFIDPHTSYTLHPPLPPAFPNLSRRLSLSLSSPALSRHPTRDLSTSVSTRCLSLSLSRHSLEADLGLVSSPRSSTGGMEIWKTAASGTTTTTTSPRLETLETSAEGARMEKMSG
jgi:hypothetical protein